MIGAKCQLRTPISTQSETKRPLRLSQRIGPAIPMMLSSENRRNRMGARIFRLQLAACMARASRGKLHAPNKKAEGCFLA
jgi:hypothetical protein